MQVALSMYIVGGGSCHAKTSTSPARILGESQRRSIWSLIQVAELESWHGGNE